MPTLVDEFVAPAAATASPFTVTEDVAPAPSVTYAAAPMIEYVAPAIPETVNTNAAPAPVIEYIAPSPAVSYLSFYPSFSQPNEAITCLVNPQIAITADETSQVHVVVQKIPEIPVVEWIQEQSAVTDLVKPQISTTSVEASQVVGSCPLLEDFAAPAKVTTLNTSSTSTSSAAHVYNRVGDAAETTQNTVEISSSSSTSTSSDRRLDEFASMLDS